MYAIRSYYGEYRLEEDNLEKLEDPGWYGDTPAWPGDIVLPVRVISTKSTFFQLRAEGIYREQSRRITAVVKRDGNNNLAILYKMVE